MNKFKHELHRLYADASKHSTYQNIPDFVSTALGYTEPIDEAWRSDRPRIAYLQKRCAPQPGEHWGDFGANTGFFTLTLAYQHPDTRFTAIEANPNHAHFIRRVAECFKLANVEVLDRTIGLYELNELPKFDFLLHLNILHHAGHDFDSNIVLSIDRFPDYAMTYMNILRKRTRRMLFQIGNNWGGDKQQPLIGTREDYAKLHMFSRWLNDAGWHINAIAYPQKAAGGFISYDDFAIPTNKALLSSTDTGLQLAISAIGLDKFHGEFYRRPLFLCQNMPIAY
ncbi:class I SAM-dependent methyltransferase [Nitrosococcus oceani]|uniref:class I SAM-dependent methyltransferase n=1 Tax=Nitrosococcus oceani TaxID=1229 RepID=UPI0004E875DB|nr:class I SAM-dependent methyltransferase [Nitrosococcus oceani]KFI21812.1 hypothetical protein HW44_13045 [Nitrosococcus oceani]